MTWKQYGITTVPDPKSSIEHDTGPEADPHSDLNLLSSLALTPTQDPNPSPQTKQCSQESKGRNCKYPSMENA